jgi:hypothetical protein
MGEVNPGPPLLTNEPSSLNSEALSLAINNGMPPPTVVTVTPSGSPTPRTIDSTPEIFFINKSTNQLWYANPAGITDSGSGINLNTSNSNFNYINLLTKTSFNANFALYKQRQETTSAFTKYNINKGNYSNGCSSANYAFAVFRSEEKHLDIQNTYILYGINYVNKKYPATNCNFFNLPNTYFPRSVSYYNTNIYVLLAKADTPFFVPIKIARISINDNPGNIGSNPFNVNAQDSIDCNDINGVIRTYDLSGGNLGSSTCDNLGNLYITIGTSANSANVGGVYKFSDPIDSTSIPVRIITNDTPANYFTTIYYSYFYNLLYVVNRTASNNIIDLYYKNGEVLKKNYITVQGVTTSKIFMDEDSFGNLYFTSSNGLMVTSPVICFKEDTKILTKTGYKLIQELKKGDLIKTLKNGYKPIYKIGYTKIDHQCSQERIKNQLYKCSPENYPELFEDLIITGCHCILVDKFKNENEREKSKEINNINVDGDYMTETKFRLPSCVDERTTVYDIAGVYKIYHLALENDDYCMNYGIYANGLLVESTSKRFMDETLMIQDD